MTFDTVENIVLEINNLIQILNVDLDIDVNLLSNKLFILKTNNLSQSDFLDLLINICIEQSSLQVSYDTLATNILFHKTNIHNDSLELKTYCDKINYIDINTPNYLSPIFTSFVNNNKNEIQNIMNKYKALPKYMTYFGYLTLNNAYHMRVNKINIETPIDIFMRCSIASVYKSDLTREQMLEHIETNISYNYQGLFTHATPSLYNAGTIHEQMSSCFLLGMQDSITGIYKNLADCAEISQKAGGIGFPISNIRAEGALIRSSNGESSGVIPMLKVFSDTAVYVNQGGRGSKRRGAFATFIEPWHADIREFLQLRLPTGAENRRTRDLFTALWIPDLFMKQLEINGDWYLMCPDKCKGLDGVYGDEFESKYWSYVEQGLYKEKIKATEIMDFISPALAEGGLPYMMFKDTVNKRCNQSNIGTVKSSNLCCEITEVADTNHHAVCNLASIAVNKFYKDGVYDYDKLISVTKHIVRNLNNFIDLNSYPTKESAQTNKATRPIGIGIQGMGNLLMDMRLAYETQEAIDVEAYIMETIYYGAIQGSMEIAKERNKTYDYFDGSYFSKGIFQFDMGYKNVKLHYDWDTLKQQVIKYGIINSLLTALMPTASTSQILGNMECFEPITTNIYGRKTSSGTFMSVNINLMQDLNNLGLWNEEMKDTIINHEGSIQNIDNIPADIKQLYKTVWEIKQKNIMDHAIARAPFVDQAQSMNIHFKALETQKIKSGMFYAWKNGLKTGSYYTRSLPAVTATNKANFKFKTNFSTKAEPVCNTDSTCESCSA